MSSSNQKIGVITATIVGMNAMIGGGIFCVPAALASHVGPAGIISYAFVILAVFFMGISLARLAYLFPEEGSFYTYASKWGGHTLGLIAAGAYLIGLIIAMGLLTQMSGTYLHGYFPQISASAFGVLTLMLLLILNMVGVSLSQTGQYILILCTVFPLVAIITLCFSKANVQNLTPFMPYGLGNIFEATKAVIFGFFGFECASSLFSVVKNPQRNVPLALVSAIVLVGLLYMLFVTSIILAVPLSHFANPNMPISDVIGFIFPNNPFLMTLVRFSILSAIIGTIHSMIWATSNLLLSYFKQFKNPTMRSLIAQNKINHSTSVLLLGACIFTTFATLKSVDLFFSLTATFIVFAFICSMITLLTMKSEWKNKHNILAVLGILTGIVILFFALHGLVLEIGKL